MKSCSYILLLLTVFAGFNSFAQDESQAPKLSSKDSIITSSSMLGLGLNFVDDSGDVFNELFALGSQWNYVPYPSRISYERSTSSGLGFGAIGTLNKYKVGNIIDGVLNAEETTYLAIDGRVTYDLNKLYNESSWFDPYLGAGIGYTDANNISRGTYNAVVGFRTWISDRWGLDFNSSGKWAIGDNGATNHIQHAVGAVYQFDIEKGLSKKGEEKQALINEIEKERQRVTDSIANANRLKEEALLAQRMAQEKEKARLAAIEQAKKNEESVRKQKILDEINALGHAHFALNSSYLSIEAKNVLKGLAEILKKNPEIELKISSHTDSRGTDKYNLWLSDRRMQRTVDFLVALGVAPERLQASSLGEAQLANHCDDDIICSEEEHLENRRSEFEVVRF